MTHTLESVKEDANQSPLSQVDLGTPIERRPQGCVIPLTAEQRYILKGLICGNPEQRPLTVRVCASATRITGQLNSGLLEQCIDGLVRRHESLRTTFRTIAGSTTQHIDSPGEYRLSLLDLSALSKSTAENEVLRLVREFQDQRIDLSIGPLFEARLFKLAAQEHVLVVLVDHMVSDGMSNALLVKEIWQAYDDALGDEPASIPTPSIQFADYAVWQERTRESWSEAHEGYWRQHLADGAPTIVPVSSECNASVEMGTVANIALGAALTAQLRQFAEREQVSLSNVMLMAYAAAMSLWCDKDDLIIRCPVHGHHRPELANVIGFLCNCLYLRIKLDRRGTLKDLLTQVRDEMRNAIAHRDFDRVLDFMPEVARTQLEFHWRSARWRGRVGRAPPHTNRLIKRQPFLIRGPTLPLNLWCIFNETTSDVFVTVCYRENLVRPSAVEKLGKDLRSIGQALIDRPLDSMGQSVFSSGCQMYDAPQ